MNLTCPLCATRYHAEEGKFPPAGRTVRCGKCKFVWHQPGFAAEPEPDAAPIEHLVTKAEIFAEAVPASGKLPPLAEVAPAQLSLRAPVPQRPTMFSLEHFVRLAVWAALSATVVLTALLAKHYRADFTSIWPHSTVLQSLLDHQIGKQGVDLRNVGYRRETDDGQTMLVISGTIANSTDHELPVPKLIRVTLSDDNNEQLFYTAFPPNLATLGAGQSVMFSARIRDVPAANLHLQMRFDAS